MRAKIYTCGISVVVTNKMRRDISAISNMRGIRLSDLIRSIINDYLANNPVEYFDFGVILPEDHMTHLGDGGDE